MFSFREDWHRDERVIPFIRQYQYTLDSVLRSRADLEPCVTCCVQCGIRFLTDRRNAHRQNLRCPFGCRDHHRRQASHQRSTAYYRTAAGKAKKRQQNAKRRTQSVEEPSTPEQPSSCGDAVGPAREAVEQAPPESHPELPPWVFEGVVFTAQLIESSATLSYLTILIGLIERRPISRDQLVSHLLEALRQHSMSGLSRKEYVLRFLDQHPP